MKLLTNKQLVQIENQVLNKIYNALKELHERDNSDSSGAVRHRHDELLDIALKHLTAAPQQNNVYGWLKSPANFVSYLLKSKYTV